MTLASVTLPSLTTFPPTPCVDSVLPPLNPTPAPLPTPENSPGLGNLLYVSTLKGLAGCFQAWGTDGLDGTPLWFSCNGSTLAGNALKIRYWDFDPASGIIDNLGTHFTAAWASTDDGLYRVTGLPLNPVWTQQLTADQAGALVGLGAGVGALGRHFEVSKRRPGHVLCVIAGEYFDGGTFFGSYWRVYVVWSKDYGLTWTGDSSHNIGNGTGASQQTIADYARIICSVHLDDVYYFVNDRFGIGALDDNHAGVGNPHIGLMVRSTSLPIFVPINSVNYSDMPTHDQGVPRVFPFYDNNGNLYSDDQVSYVLTGDGGLSEILRIIRTVDPPWTSGYTPPLGNHSGYSGMPALTLLSPNLFQEDYAVGIGNGVWLTQDLTDATPTWVHSASLTYSGRTVVAIHGSPVPANKSAVFVCGKKDSGTGGLGAVWHTPDFGTTWVLDDLDGTANSFSNVMGLGTDNTPPTFMDSSQILVDRQYEGAPLPSGAATMIDVSHYQGAINWATAYSAGIRKTFIKATESSSITDASFSTNWAGALAQSIARGAYHYFINSVDPTAQANHFLAVATSAGELGYAVDCEDESGTLDSANLKTFLDRVEAISGKKCTIYTRASWWNFYVGFQSWTKDYPLWVAHWNVAVPTIPTGWTEWVYWQFTP
jgi:hypothetical protein